MLNPNNVARGLLSSLRLPLLLLSSAVLGCTGVSVNAPTPGPPGLDPLSATLVLEGADVVVLDPTPHLEHDRSIVADGERIVWIGPAQKRPPVGDATVVDVSGRFVIAGLSDMHAHLPGEDDAPFTLQTYLELQLSSGVTSIRSMRGEPSHAEVRTAIASGTRAGPDLQLASAPISAQSLSYEESQRLIETAERDGADFIKLLGVGDAQSYRNLMRAAQEAGFPVAGHLPTSVPAELAAELGQQSIEHLGGILDAVAAGNSAAQATAIALAQPGVFHCPTLHWYALGLGVYDPADFEGDAALASVSAAARSQWDATLSQRRVGLEGRALDPIEDRLRALKLLHETGALLVIGPDTGGAYGLPGSAVHDEMRLFADAGIPTAEILRAATSNAAALRGAADEGAVTEG
ncbi:MAG: amidohydrolase family protein, partial [Nannocystaceae bacterium]|nr:amidohydrolase family protein [Nannocystaceae bacterium]